MVLIHCLAVLAALNDNAVLDWHALSEKERQRHRDRARGIDIETETRVVCDECKYVVDTSETVHGRCLQCCAH